MPKYKKTLPGPPYVRNSPLTEGFQPGVGYIKNIVANRPSWAACLLYLGVGTVIMTYSALASGKESPEERLMYLEAYKVRRREDVADPSNEFFN